MASLLRYAKTCTSRPPKPDLSIAVSCRTKKAITSLRDSHRLLGFRNGLRRLRCVARARSAARVHDIQLLGTFRDCTVDYAISMAQRMTALAPPHTHTRFGLKCPVSWKSNYPPPQPQGNKENIANTARYLHSIVSTSRPAPSMITASKDTIERSRDCSVIMNCLRLLLPTQR
jgi:hypothetical protein